MSLGFVIPSATFSIAVGAVLIGLGLIRESYLCILVGYTFAFVGTISLLRLMGCGTP